VLKKPRSLQVFEQSLTSEVTRSNYLGRLDAFMRFLEIENYDHLIKTDPKTLQIHVEDYVIYLKKKHERGAFRARSFNTYLTPIEHFFVQNDITLNFKKIRKWFPKHEKLTGQDAYSNEDIKKLLSVASLRWRAIIHFFASTGVRPGAIFDLKMKDLVFDRFEGSAQVIIYEGDNEEYYAFLTPEATLALNEYLKKREFDGEKITSESPVFRNHYKETIAWQNVKSMNISTFYASFYQLAKKAGIRKPKQERRDRHNKRLLYGFRKRFNTILKNNQNINSNTAEKLMGHKNGLDGVYYNPTLEKRFEEYKKAIPELTVDDSERKQALLNQAVKEKSELENEKIKHDELANDFEEFKEEMKSFIKEIREKENSNSENILPPAKNSPDLTKKS